MKSLIKDERHLRIIQLLRDQGKVAIQDLSREIGVSEITIRRDLQDMADRGMIHRVYGGAIVAQSNLQDLPILQRIQQERRAKEIIGKATADLVRDGESIFLGSGSTTAYVARALTTRKRLTVITNALNVGMEFSATEGFTVVVVGGMMRPSELSLIGHITDQAIREVRVDKVIMGITAVSVTAGLSNDYLPEVVTDRAILAMAPEVILVADHTKFGKLASAFVAPLSQITTLVTDPETDQYSLEKIRDMGIRVIIAEDTRPA